MTCAVELPYLTELTEQEGISIVGLYFDQDLDPEFGTKTLNRVQQEVEEITSRFGNPYQFHIFDVYRDTALDLGVTVMRMKNEIIRREYHRPWVKDLAARALGDDHAV